ncbi:hypothetical protein [Pseudonocardia kongjuensis]|uniref:trypsin-like serine peptidase n=1 Tax=Pseudonocardia kongjuensis TaxID=102227 RepID=UPI0031E3F6A5
MTRRTIVVIAVAVLLLGWAVGLVGWWLTTDSRGSGVTPSAAARLDLAERARYSDGAGPAPSTVGILANDEKACTATMVSSNSGSVLATAAHCVYADDRWVEGLRFHPGYSRGDSRFGIWDLEGAWVPAAWQQTAGRAGAQFRSEHDIAFVRLAPDAAGNRAQDVLGAQGFSFDNPPAARSRSPATPASRPTTARPSSPVQGSPTTSAAPTVSSSASTAT